MIDSDLENLLRIINKETKTYGNINLEDEDEGNSFFIEYINNEIDRMVLFKPKDLKYINVNDTFYLIKHKNAKYSSIVSCLRGDFHLFSLPELRGKSNIIYNFINNILPHYKNINEKRWNNTCNITFKEKSLAQKINSLMKIDEILYDTRHECFLYKIKFNRINSKKINEVMNTEFLDSIIKAESTVSSNIIKDFISGYFKISTYKNPPNILIEKLKNIYSKYTINDYFEGERQFSHKSINKINYNIKNSNCLSIEKENIEDIEAMKIKGLDEIFLKSGKKFSIKEIRQVISKVSDIYIRPSDIFLTCRDSKVDLYINHRKTDKFPNKEINIDSIITKISLNKILDLYISLIKETEIETSNIIRIIKEYKENNKEVKLLNLPSFIKILNMRDTENINEKILISFKNKKCFKLIDLNDDNFYEKIIIDLEKIK